MNRENQIEQILSTMKTQEKWIEERNNNIDKLMIVYRAELEEYRPIFDSYDYNNMDVGGYIRYVDSNNEIKWGGILLKKIKKNNIDYMIVANSQMKCITVSFYRNTIFYKKHTTASDKNRKLFISYLDKME